MGITLADQIAMNTGNSRAPEELGASAQRGGNDAPWKKDSKPEFPTPSPGLGNPANYAGFPHSPSAGGRFHS